MIGEWMNDYDGVFARFDNFVQITNRAVTDSRSQRPVVPNGFFAFDQKPADEISRRKIFMTSDRDQWPLKPPSHVLDKARLATAGRAFQNHRQARRVRRFEQTDFIVDRQVVRLVRYLVLFDGAFRHGSWYARLRRAGDDQ